MSRHATKDEIVGKTVARILQTEWEHFEDFSGCDFYIEFTDGTLIRLEYGSLVWIDACERNSVTLRNVDVDSDFPGLWSSDGFTGAGAAIEKVLKTSAGGSYLQLSGRYYLMSEDCEGQTALGIHDHDDWLRYARTCEFLDYWTDEPCIFDNMRAISVFVEANDVALWQSRELFLSIGRVRDGQVRETVGVVNEPNGSGWSARFVVPEVGTYRIEVQRHHDNFVLDVLIDEAMIDRGRLDVRVT